MDAVDFLGFVAGSFVVATFYCRNAVWLRCFAVVSNLLFLSYGFLAGLAPVASLHLILLPLNLVRLDEALGGDGWPGDWRSVEAEVKFPSQSPPAGCRLWC